MPYSRKTITFKNVYDQVNKVNLVQVHNIGVDKTPFEKRHDPGHPGADKNGYVLEPNVKSLIEVMDMREAQRSYEANVNAIDTARAMLMRTIGIING